MPPLIELNCQHWSNTEKNFMLLHIIALQSLLQVLPKKLTLKSGQYNNGENRGLKRFGREITDCHKIKF